MPYHMRRMDKEIKDHDKLEEILRETRYVTIGMCRDNIPYLVTLSHSYSKTEGCLYFHCASEGKKLDFMRANPQVWGQALIDHGYNEGKCSHLYISAMFKGRVEFVQDPSEKKKILGYMVRHQEKNPELTLNSPTGMANVGEMGKTAVGRILIEELRGKKSTEVDF